MAAIRGKFLRLALLLQPVLDRTGAQVVAGSGPGCFEQPLADFAVPAVVTAHSAMCRGPKLERHWVEAR